jgi:hypothetical protein
MADNFKADSEMVWINQARRKCDEWAKVGYCSSEIHQVN